MRIVRARSRRSMSRPWNAASPPHAATGSGRSSRSTISGSKAAMRLIAEADVVLALGCRLNPFGTLPQHGIDYWPADAKIIQIDAEPLAGWASAVMADMPDRLDLVEQGLGRRCDQVDHVVIVEQSSMSVACPRST